MNLANRIIELRNAKNWSQLDLAECAGTSQQQIQTIEAGKVSQPRNIEVLAMCLDTSPGYLKFGESNRVEVSNANPYAADQQYVYLRLYNVSASAGNGLENGEESIEAPHVFPRGLLVQHNASSQNCAVIKIVGDSMSPTLIHDDFAVINLGDKDISKSGPFAIATPNGLRVKRLYQQFDGKVRVVSDNSNKQQYPDDYLHDDIDVMLIGRVIGKSGSVN